MKSKLTCLLDAAAAVAFAGTVKAEPKAEVYIGGHQVAKLNRLPFCKKSSQVAGVNGQICLSPVGRRCGNDGSSSSSLVWETLQLLFNSRVHGVVRGRGAMTFPR